VTESRRQIVESIQGPADFQKAFGVSRETVDRLSAYEILLRKWQPTINLVAPSTVEHIWHRHFADSAQILALAPVMRHLCWLDLGSGAGFPGLVIAILLAEKGGSQVTLIESDTRKAAFLREVLREMKFEGSVTVDITVARIESAANQARVGAVAVVSARALAPLPKLLGLVFPFFRPETTGLFLKGRGVEAEVEAAKQNFAFDAQLQPSLTDAEAKIVVLRGLVGRS
jgi:16S rRNA (guanine527-N7)-methyltransferase